MWIPLAHIVVTPSVYCSNYFICFKTGMHLNGNMLGLAVAPLPGFGILGKVPARFAHLVELKKSVRDKAWAHWMAAPGLVTHNTSHKSKQGASSSGGGNHGSSGNAGASKSKIRLTAGTSGNGSSSAGPSVPAISNAGLASNDAANVNSTAPPVGAAQPNEIMNTTSTNIPADVPQPLTSTSTSTANFSSESTDLEVDLLTATAIESSNMHKHKTQFVLHKPAKKLCKRSPFEKRYFMMDTYSED